MAQSIDNLKKDIKLIADAIKQGETAFADGFQFTDLFGFVNVLSQLPEAIKAKDALISEITKLDQEAANEVVDYINEVFTIGNKKLERNIKDAVAVIFAVLAFIKGVKAEPTVEVVA